MKEYYYKLSLLREINCGVAIREEIYLKINDNKPEIINHSPQSLSPLNSKLERISKKEAEKILNKDENKKDNCSNKII